jgi:acetoacetyl-CoA synthetase
MESALPEVLEGAIEIRDITWAQLRLEVGRQADATRKRGLQDGDRVAVVASNSVDTLVVFLAILCLGEIFSNSSMDIGVQGVLASKDGPNYTEGEISVLISKPLDKIA